MWCEHVVVRVNKTKCSVFSFSVTVFLARSANFSLLLIRAHKSLSVDCILDISAESCSNVVSAEMLFLLD